MGPDDQGGFNWTVTFTSDNQDGDLPLLTVEADDITATGALMEVYSLEDGSYLDGFVNVTFAGNSSQVAANATAEEMRVALEDLGTGGLAVSREGIPKTVYRFCKIVLLGFVEVSWALRSRHKNANCVSC